MAVGLRLDDQLAVNHVHPTGEPELTRTVRQDLDGRPCVSSERPIERELRKDHPGGAFAAFLAVENYPQWNALTNPDQVGGVAAIHSHRDFLNVPDLFRRVRFLGAEEEPAQQTGDRQPTGEHDDVSRVQGITGL